VAFFLLSPEGVKGGGWKMHKVETENSGNVPFLFVVDDAELKSHGMMAYGDPIRTSIACSDVSSRTVSSYCSEVKWMTIYSEKDDEPEQHALVWHNACFAF
jgi:hypothetical protein